MSRLRHAVTARGSARSRFCRIPESVGRKSTRLLRSDDEGFLGHRSFVETYEFPEFRVVAQAFEIGILGRPTGVAITGSEGLLNRLKGFRLFSQDAVGAGGVVKRVGVAGAK